MELLLGICFLVAISVDYLWDGFCSKSMRRIVKRIQAKSQLSNNADRKNHLSNIGSQLAREIHGGRFKWFSRVFHCAKSLKFQSTWVPNQQSCQNIHKIKIIAVSPMLVQSQNRPSQTFGTPFNLIVILIIRCIGNLHYLNVEQLLRSQ